MESDSTGTDKANELARKFAGVEKVSKTKTHSDR